MSDQTKPVAATADTASFLIGIGAVLAEVRLQPPAAAPPVPCGLFARVVSCTSHRIASHRIASQVTLSGAVSIYFEKVNERHAEYNMRYGTTHTTCQMANRRIAANAALHGYSAYVTWRGRTPQLLPVGVQLRTGWSLPAVCCHRGASFWRHCVSAHERTLRARIAVALDDAAGAEGLGAPAHGLGAEPAGNALSGLCVAWLSGRCGVRRLRVCGVCVHCDPNVCAPQGCTYADGWVWDTRCMGSSAPQCERLGKPRRRAPRSFLQAAAAPSQTFAGSQLGVRLPA